MLAMAGYLAEMKGAGTTRERALAASKGDQDKINRSLRNLWANTNRMELRRDFVKAMTLMLETKTSELLAKHWRSVAKVQRALLKRGYLDHEDVAALLKRR
jgi:SOS response regulatory protein OraA/RecX